MKICDIIAKKRDGNVLSKEEIAFFIDGVTCGDIADYQAAALLMAIRINGMSEAEIIDLTLAMVNSGKTLDLSGISGFKVDKHSTGGVGDKTTLIVSPIVAACGLKVAKMSGRGLGFTGGTIDKLESIPGFRTSLSTGEFVSTVNRTGLSVVGQNADLAPADKKLYALRDVTATIDSIPLIVSSIMSKKLAAGADGIVLDVKTGSGAFMKTEAEAMELATQMVKIGSAANKKVCALITDMSMPLGKSVGNITEIKEAVRTLNGEGEEDLETVCLELASAMLEIGGISEARKEAERVLRNGEAFEKLCEFVTAQGGDERYLRNLSLFPTAKYSLEICASSDGWINKVDALSIGETSRLLGAGRNTKDDKIDVAAGVEIKCKHGKVRSGEVIMTLMSNNPIKKEVEECALKAFEIENEEKIQGKIILAKIGRYKNEKDSYFRRN